jgi:hypothetical protein
MSQGLIRANYCFAYIKCQSIELQCANINIQQAFAQNLSSQLFPNSTILYAVLHALSNDVHQIGAQAHQRQVLIRC